MEYLLNKKMFLVSFLIVNMSVQVRHLIAHIIPKQHRWKMDLFQQWNSIIGSLRDKVRIEKIVGDKLILGVIHPAWAQELFMMSHVIKDKVNNALKQERIKEVRVRAVDFAEATQKTANRKRQYDRLSTTTREVISLSWSEKKALSGVDNKELREELRKFYIRCKERGIFYGQNK
jgi:hypothetical protein